MSESASGTDRTLMVPSSLEDGLIHGALVTTARISRALSETRRAAAIA